MWVEILLKGILIGFIASIPLGPIGVMCIQRTLSKSRKSGFISGLGAATADSVFASVALFSLSMVMSFIEDNISLIKVLGGISVVIVGVIIMMKNPVVQIRRNRAGKGSLWSDYLSLFFMTFANPTYMLIFVALFAALGISSEGINYIEGVIMILGVWIGGSLWWFNLTLGVNRLRTKFRPRHLLWINRISGAVVVVLGAAAILSIFIKISVNGIMP